MLALKIAFPDEPLFAIGVEGGADRGFRRFAPQVQPVFVCGVPWGVGGERGQVRTTVSAAL